jgi:hypothetical protein
MQESRVTGMDRKRHYREPRITLLSLVTPAQAGAHCLCFQKKLKVTGCLLAQA